MPTEPCERQTCHRSQAAGACRCPRTAPSPTRRWSGHRRSIPMMAAATCGRSRRPRSRRSGTARSPRGRSSLLYPRVAGRARVSGEHIEQTGHAARAGRVRSLAVAVPSWYIGGHSWPFCPEARVRIIFAVLSALVAAILLVGVFWSDQAALLGNRSPGSAARGGRARERGRALSALTLGAARALGSGVGHVRDRVAFRRPDCAHDRVSAQRARRGWPGSDGRLWFGCWRCSCRTRWSCRPRNCSGSGSRWAESQVMTPRGLGACAARVFAGARRGYR